MQLDVSKNCEIVTRRQFQWLTHPSVSEFYNKISIKKILVDSSIEISKYVIFSCRVQPSKELCLKHFFF